MGLELTLRNAPDVPLEAEVLSPDRVAGLSESDVAKLVVQHGNQQAELGEFFDVAAGAGGADLQLIGNLSAVKMIGAGMTRGTVLVDGNVGLHLGHGMSGGEITVDGNADDWVGPEMSGGRIIVKGNAGHTVGAAYRGSRIGMRGGEIIVHGNAGNEVGNAMRNGLIAIGGDCGDFAGVNMLAGTIIVLGQLGLRGGAGMKRGSIVCMNDATVLPTFSYACAIDPVYLRLYLSHLRSFGLHVRDDQITGRYHRWSGDSVELNRGELLLFEQ